MIDEFAYLKSKSADFWRYPERWRTRQGMVELVCRDCPFWKEDEKEGYECGGFRLLRRLLEKGALKMEEILDAIDE